WRDGDGGIWTIALSPDGKKVVSGSEVGAVRLWDIATSRVITKWTGHTKLVVSICWSRDGRKVLSGANDGTARQWNAESGETILEPIVTGHEHVWAVVYSPDMTLIATGGLDGPLTNKPTECSIKIWDAKTGKLVATLQGHTNAVRCLAWTKDGKTLISGSFDCSIRTWNTTRWVQTAVLDEHARAVYAIAISANGRVLASVSGDNTARLWNLDDGQPISSPLQHAEQVTCVSFSADGKQLATGCWDKNAYIWDVAAILGEVGRDDLLSDSQANKSALHANATRRPFSARSRPHSSAPPGSTFLGRLFHHRPSDAHDTSPSSPLDWARNLLRLRRQSGEEIGLQGCSPAVVEVPYAKGKRRNASAREKKKTKPLRPKNTTADNSRPPKPGVTRQSGTATQAHPPSQPQSAPSSSSTTSAVGDTTIAATSTPSRPDATIRQAGLWTRFWLFIGCLSPEYTDSHH
ncbi:WD40 repeat-like protein, partial [Suillus weaverae]